MNELMAMLSRVPAPVLEAVTDMIEAVLHSPDPRRTAIRQAKMIAARTATEAACREALGND